MKKPGMKISTHYDCCDNYEILYYSIIRRTWGERYRTLRNAIYRIGTYLAKAFEKLNIVLSEIQILIGTVFVYYIYSTRNRCFCVVEYITVRTCTGILDRSSVTLQG